MSLVRLNFFLKLVTIRMIKRIRKLYVVMVSDVKVRRGKIDTMSILAFLRQDVA